MDPCDSALSIKVPYGSPKNPFLHSLLRTSQSNTTRQTQPELVKADPSAQQPELIQKPAEATEHLGDANQN